MRLFCKESMKVDTSKQYFGVMKNVLFCQKYIISEEVKINSKNHFCVIAKMVKLVKNDKLQINKWSRKTMTKKMQQLPPRW